MQGDALTLVGIYRRTVRASLERIWENVLDWERLPWLHRRVFCSVQLLDQTADSWRAQVSLAPAEKGQESIIEVRLERPTLHYSTKTISGTGAGTEILTYLEPVEERLTRIYVEFRSPGIAPHQTASANAVFTRIYTLLWNEDEAMMVRRQAVLDEENAQSAGPARRIHPREETPVPLGSVATLRGRLPCLVSVHGRTFRILEIDGTLVAHATVCPHRGGPLEEAPVIDGCVTCPWHGYRYEVRTGMSLGGRPLRLATAPSVLVDHRTQEAFLIFPSPPRRS